MTKTQQLLALCEAATPGLQYDIIERLRQHALPDPHDEREVMHAPLLRDAAQEIETLRQRVRELENENAKLKTVPMKYRRMEFNAALQKKLTAATLALETENAAATRYAQQVAHWVEKYDALRQRIADAPVVADVSSWWNGGTGFDLCNFKGKRPEPGAKLIIKEDLL